MKKMLLALIAVSTIAFSQDLAFHKGTNVINLGLNVVAWHGVGIVAAGDHGAFNNMFSMGGELGFYTYVNKYWLENISYTSLSPNFRFAFHPFGIPAVEAKGKKVFSVLDPYAVAKLGFTLSWLKYEYEDPRLNKKVSSISSSPYDFFNLNLGVRWLFTKNANLWAELGPWNFVIGAGWKF